MLGQKNALATVAVKDLAVARKFYEGQLGLKVAGPTGPEVLTFETGTSKILVYKSQFAGTNQADAPYASRANSRSMRPSSGRRFSAMSMPASDLMWAMQRLPISLETWLIGCQRPRCRPVMLAKYSSAQKNKSLTLRPHARSRRARTT